LSKQSQFGVLHLDSGQKVRDVEIQAMPLAVITGKVVDAEGDPVPGAQVGAVHAIWLLGKRNYQDAGSAEADERGEFRLEDLDPGGYKLFANAPVRGPLGFTISEGPGKSEFHLAPIFLRAMIWMRLRRWTCVPGQELGGIEIKLPMLPAFHLRGKAEVPPGRK
jgi:hypothetical protein